MQVCPGRGLLSGKEAGHPRDRSGEHGVLSGVAVRWKQGRQLGILAGIDPSPARLGPMASRAAGLCGQLACKSWVRVLFEQLVWPCLLWILGLSTVRIQEHLLGMTVMDASELRECSSSSVLCPVLPCPASTAFSVMGEISCMCEERSGCREWLHVQTPKCTGSRGFV